MPERSWVLCGFVCGAERTLIASRAIVHVVTYLGGVMIVTCAIRYDAVVLFVAQCF